MKRRLAVAVIQAKELRGPAEPTGGPASGLRADRLWFLRFCSDVETLEFLAQGSSFRRRLSLRGQFLFHYAIDGGIEEGLTSMQQPALYALVRIAVIQMLASS